MVNEATGDKKISAADTHVLFFVFFSTLAFGLILFILNTFGIMYSPLSCYKPSDKTL